MPRRSTRRWVRWSLPSAPCSEPGARASLLRGDWLGHAVHPLLTDVVIGTWTSATLLDLFGGRDSSEPAKRLIGIGLLAVGPTAWTGWAEWSAAGSRDKRVGLVHAVTNGVAIGATRRRGRPQAGPSRRRGQAAMAGAAVLGIGGYLGGHLAATRKVGSHHPAYDKAPLGI